MIYVNLLLPEKGDILKIKCQEDMNSDCLMEEIRSLLPELPLRRSWLCHVEERHILSHNQSLYANGITDGSSLIPI